MKRFAAFVLILSLCAAQSFAGTIYSPGVPIHNHTSSGDGGVLSTQTAIVQATAFPAANEVLITDIPQTYSALLVQISGASSNTATRRVELQVSTDNGATYDSTASNYAGFNAIASVGIGATADATLYEGQNQAAAQATTVSILINGYQGGVFPFAIGGGLGAANKEWSWITHISTDNIDAIRLFWNGTGNFDAGTYALYGVR